MKGHQSHCDSRTVGVRNAANLTHRHHDDHDDDDDDDDERVFSSVETFPFETPAFSRSRGRGERARAVPEVENLCKFTVKSLEVLFKWEIFPLNPHSERMQTNKLQLSRREQHDNLSENSSQIFFSN